MIETLQGLLIGIVIIILIDRFNTWWVEGWTK